MSSPSTSETSVGSLRLEDAYPFDLPPAALTDQALEAHDASWIASGAPSTAPTTLFTSEASEDIEDLDDALLEGPEDPEDELIWVVEGPDLWQMQLWSLLNIQIRHYIRARDQDHATGALDELELQRERASQLNEMGAFPDPATEEMLRTRLAQLAGGLEDEVQRHIDEIRQRRDQHHQRLRGTWTELDGDEDRWEALLDAMDTGLVRIAQMPPTEHDFHDPFPHELARLYHLSDVFVMIRILESLEWRGMGDLGLDLPQGPPPTGLPSHPATLAVGLLDHDTQWPGSIPDQPGGIDLLLISPVFDPITFEPTWLGKELEGAARMEAALAAAQGHHPVDLSSVIPQWPGLAFPTGLAAESGPGSDSGVELDEGHIV